MRVLIFIASIFFVTASYAQNINYGLPSIERELDLGDRIIINVPNQVDGRFKNSTELDDLKTFLQFHSELTFNLSVHIFGGNSKLCVAYSRFLSKNLEKLLNCGNVTIESRGNKDPLFLDENSVRYFTLNSRIEIVIEDKNDP